MKLTMNGTWSVKNLGSRICHGSSSLLSNRNTSLGGPVSSVENSRFKNRTRGGLRALTSNDHFPAGDSNAEAVQGYSIP